MSFGIANFDSLPDNVKLAFEDLEAWANAFLLKEHNPDGTHVAYAAKVDPSQRAALGTTSAGTTPAANVESHHWFKGPWTFDLEGQSNGIIGLRPSNLGAGPFHNFGSTVDGFDDAMFIEMVPDASITITGFRQFANQKRLLIFGNKNGQGYTITLTHASTSSTANYRFSFPSSTDVVLVDGQFVWLYYDIDVSRWRCFVTGQQSGNLALMSGVVSEATVTLTNDQIKALNTTPITIVSAPGSGFAVMPIGMFFHTVQVAGYNTSSGLTLRFSGETSDLSTSTNFATNVAGNFVKSAAMAGWAQITNTDAENLAVVLRGSVDLTSGNAGNSCKVTVYYMTAAL